MESYSVDIGVTIGIAKATAEKTIHTCNGPCESCGGEMIHVHDSESNVVIQGHAKDIAEWCLSIIDKITEEGIVSLFEKLDDGINPNNREENPNG